MAPVKITQICRYEGCGRSFETDTGQIRAGYGKYCSRACARRGSPTRKRIRVTFTCARQGCGHVFERRPADVQKMKGALAFCSTNCWALHARGPQNPNWTGGHHLRLRAELVAWRRAVLARDHRHCRLCYSGDRPQAHHIKPLRSHPELATEISNGITLCRKCHLGLGRREREIEAELTVLASIRFHYVPARAGIAGVIAAMAHCDEASQHHDDLPLFKGTGHNENPGA